MTYSIDIVQASGEQKTILSPQRSDITSAVDQITFHSGNTLTFVRSDGMSLKIGWNSYTGYDMSLNGNGVTLTDDVVFVTKRTVVSILNRFSKGDDVRNMNIWSSPFTSAKRKELKAKGILFSRYLSLLVTVYLVISYLSSSSTIHGSSTFALIVLFSGLLFLSWFGTYFVYADEFGKMARLIQNGGNDIRIFFVIVLVAMLVSIGYLFHAYFSS
ncbi:MAG: hypothetical protein LAT68_17500 [Cyclobacteriaceae bacterium]|nr:hypothetical protein [Cyclobacteriaceae bacterium]